MRGDGKTFSETNEAYMYVMCGAPSSNIAAAF